jgi:hypothetical protein
MVSSVLESIFRAVPSIPNPSTLQGIISDLLMNKIDLSLLVVSKVRLWSSFSVIRGSSVEKYLHI